MGLGATRQETTLGMRLWLASGSPRRVELLRQLGVAHQQRVAEIDESPLPGEAPYDYVQRMALGKAQALSRRLSQQGPSDYHEWVLGADTTVYRGADIFGKPKNKQDGLQMLQRLSGGTHEVLTAVALVSQNTIKQRVSVSKVRFKSLTAEEMTAYWDTSEPEGKAGGYAIQGFGAAFIEDLCGSYSGVMGLPLFETAELLREAGIPIWSLVNP